MGNKIVDISALQRYLATNLILRQSLLHLMHQEHQHFQLQGNKTLASEKNITLSLIDTNTSEDNRLHMLQMTGDGNTFLANDGTYKTVAIPTIEYCTNNDIINLFN